MKFTNLMIDLETLGTAPNAPVIAIGAVFFDPATGNLGDTFDAAIDLADAVRYGRADGNTIKWWMGQSESARQNVTRGRHTAAQAWEAFHKFCLKHGTAVKPWGNGSSFDISICDYAFGRVLDKTSPWKFWNVRDCRTIKELADGIVTFNEKLEGTAHTALDDAMHQAKWVSAYWQGLKGQKAAPVAVSAKVTADLDLDLD